MAPLRSDTLASALSRIFEGPMIDRASWFALTGGERLFTAGDPSDTLYLVRSGRLGVFHSEPDQPVHLLGVVRPGEPVGEMAMLAGTPHTADVVALRDTEILALPREAFFEAARTEPADKPDSMLDPDAIALSYWNVLQQPRSAWTWELELRPWVEKF